MRMMRMWRLAAVTGIALTVAGVLAPEARAQAFGASVVVQGDEMLVAEPQNQSTPGYVYVYRRAGDVWTEVGRLEAPDAQPGDGFGAALDADGGTMVSSSRTAAGGMGEAYVFTRSGSGAWTWRSG